MVRDGPRPADVYAGAMLRSPVLRLVLAAAVLVPAAPAGAAEFADPSTPGPALSVSQRDVDSILTCSAGVDGATRAPVLLVQGTGATAKDNWSWTYEPGLDQLGIPWCALDVPEHATQDIQRSGELLVGAIRTMHRRAGRRIAIIGHSQGGMSPRFALRFWPDTRDMVDDMIGFAPSNHGSDRGSCSTSSPCSAAGWQQDDQAKFIRAVNSGAETWAGISYTNVYTRTDETVQPNMDDTGSSSLRTGAGSIENEATQEVCPNAAYEHLAVGTVDAVAFALALDALEHPGPAVPMRVDPVTTCSRTYHQGVNTATVAADAAAAVQSFETYQPKEFTEEPALRCYVTATCGTPAAAALAAKPTRTCVSRRRFTITVPPLDGLRVTVAGKRIKVRGTGARRRATIDLRGKPRQRVVVRVTGRASGKRVTQVRRYRTCA